MAASLSFRVNVAPQSLGQMVYFRKSSWKTAQQVRKRYWNCILAWEAYNEAGSEIGFVSANSAYWPIVLPNYLSNRLIGIVCLSLRQQQNVFQRCEMERLGYPFRTRTLA